jgi:O-antigen ligase
MHSTIFISFIILSGYLFVTLLWTEDASVKGYYKSLYHFITISVFICITAELITTYAGLEKKLFLFLCWSGVLGGILYFIVFYPKLSFPPLRLEYIGSIQNAIRIGNVYSMLLIILYFYLYKMSDQIKNKLIYIVLSFIFLFFIILTQSRGAIVSLSVAFFIGAILSKDKQLLLILLCVCLLVSWGYILSNTIHDWLYSGIIMRKDSYRLEIFRSTLVKIFETTRSFLWGHGILVNTHFNLKNGLLILHPHSLYLTTWLYGGIIGLLLFLAMLLVSLKQAIVYFQKEKDILFIVLLIHAYLSVFTNYARVIGHPTPLMLCFWLPISLLCAYEIKNNITVKIQRPDRLITSQ